MRREQEGAAGRADLMARTADPLRRGRDGGRRVDENDFVDGADVDAEFERRRGDDGLQFSCLHALFDGLADFLRERAMVRDGEKIALPVIDVLRDFLACVSCVAENQRGMVGLEMRTDDLRDTPPRIVVGDGCVRFGQQADVYIQLPCVRTFDDGDRAGGGRCRPRGGSRREGRRGFGGFDGGGKGDALEITREFREPFQ